MASHRTRKNRNANSEGSRGSITPAVRERLRRMIISDLSMQERLLIVLAYAERMSPAEIGSVLNIAPKQVEAIRESIVARLGLAVQSGVQ